MEIERRHRTAVQLTLTYLVVCSSTTAVLHYFGRGGDWYIIERDSTDEQHQAFGIACLTGEYPEKGYISIAELLENSVELDLHWTPKTIGELNLSNG